MHRYSSCRRSMNQFAYHLLIEVTSIWLLREVDAAFVSLVITVCTNSEIIRKFSIVA